MEEKKKSFFNSFIIFNMTVNYRIGLICFVWVIKKTNKKLEKMIYKIQKNLFIELHQLKGLFYL